MKNIVNVLHEAMFSFKLDSLLSAINAFSLQVKKLPVTQSTGDYQSQERVPKIKLRHP